VPNKVTGRPMKASKLTAAAYILLPAFLFLVLGWLIHPWLLNAVMAGSEVALVYPSINALVFGGLWTVLSLALLGVVTGGCILFLRYKTATRTVAGIATGLVLIAVVSAAAWLFFIQYKTALASRSLIGMEFLTGMVAISVEDIPVYETGIFASIIVLLTTWLFSFWVNQKKTSEKRL